VFFDHASRILVLEEDDFTYVSAALTGDGFLACVTTPTAGARAESLRLTVEYKVPSRH
jgi:hypothetical protein